MTELESTKPKALRVEMAMNILLDAVEDRATEVVSVREPDGGCRYEVRGAMPETLGVVQATVRIGPSGYVSLKRA